MILAGDENIWNRPGVEGAALRPPCRVQGQSPHSLKINCVLKALDCLKFVAKIKQVTFFSLIILFNFVQFLISFWICFFIVFSSRHFHSWSVLWTSIFLVDFPCWAVYLKYQRNSQKHPTKLEILKTYLSTLTDDTVPISITQIYQKVRGPCMAVLYSTDVYMSCTWVSFTNWPGLNRSTKRHARPCPRWDSKAGLITRLILW